MQITPLPGCVFIEHVEPAEARALIVLPEGMDMKERNGGQIVAVADFKHVPVDCCPECCPNFVEGMDRAPMDTRVGQYAVFKPRSGDIFSIKGRTFFNVKESDLLATFDTLHDFQRLT